MKEDDKQDYDTNDNPGVMMKAKLFSEKGHHVCNRLMDKMDRGFDIE